MFVDYNYRTTPSRSELDRHGDRGGVVELSTTVRRMNKSRSRGDQDSAEDR